MVRLGQDMLDLKLNMYATSIKPDSVNHTQQISQICKICKSPHSVTLGVCLAFSYFLN